METRKIQLIAGSTYSVSLPKKWIKRIGLKEQDEVGIDEKPDRSLSIIPFAKEEKRLQDIIIDVDEYSTTIKQVLYSLYYLGIENITLRSEKGFDKNTQGFIRKGVSRMSGTEITFEDEHKIMIKVLLDKSRVSIQQVVYRIYLIIKSSLANISGDLDLKEVELNENEIDRLYHLVSKILSLGIVDSSVLASSEIKNINLVLPYFLITKRLENMGDNIRYIADFLKKKNKSIKKEREILDFIRTELDSNIKHLLNPSSMIDRIKTEDLESIRKRIERVKDPTLQKYLENLVRYTKDINEEVIVISFLVYIEKVKV